MDKIKDNLPIISIAILVIGTINMMMFYNYFNINIMTYLDFTEVLQIQFRLFAIVALVILLVTTMVYFIVLRLTGMVSSKELTSVIRYRELLKETKLIIQSELLIRRTFKEKQEIKNWEESERRGRGSLSNINLAASAMFLISVSAFGFYNIYAGYDSLAIIGLQSSIPMLAIFIFLGYIKFDDLIKVGIKVVDETNVKFITTITSDYINIRYIVVFMFFVYASAVIGYTNAIAYLNVKTSIYEATVVMDKRTIKTNAYYRFIGKTKSYIFFYNIKNKQAEVYPTGDIKSMYIKNGVNYVYTPRCATSKLKEPLPQR